MPLPSIVELATERLIVRPVAERDLGDLHAINGDEEVTRFLPYETWRSPDDGRHWLGRMRALSEGGSGRQLVLALHSTGTVVGTVLVFRFDEPSRRAEIGYVLGRSHWRQGLMLEALRAVCGHAFTVLGLRRLEAEVDIANVASIRLLQRLGFLQEGLLRQRWEAKGRRYDVAFHGALASEWLAAAPGLAHARSKRHDAPSTRPKHVVVRTGTADADRRHGGPRK